MKEKLKYIPAVLTLMAGLITCIITILNKYGALEMTVTVLVALIVFYIFGLILKVVLEKNFVMDDKEDSQDDAEQENADSGVDKDVSGEETDEDGKSAEE